MIFSPETYHPLRCKHCTQLVCEYSTTRCLAFYLNGKYQDIKKRCKGIGDRNKGYLGITCAFTVKQFVKWGIETIPKGMTRPSIDRIDPTKGYEFFNIQWIEMNQNARKGNRDLGDDQQRCYECKEVKHESEFCVSKSARHGRANHCKSCAAVKSMAIYYRKKSA